MRGLPGSGKSYAAKYLTGKTGIVCETDQYFYTEVGNDPCSYDYRADLIEAGRRWNFTNFQKALDQGITPIVVDRGNSLSLVSQQYAQYAIDQGYKVAFKEPESTWWQEIRVLLKYKRYTRPVLSAWAERLEQISRPKHRVSAAVILHRMDRWRWDLTVQDILDFHRKKDDISLSDTRPGLKYAKESLDQVASELTFDAVTGAIQSAEDEKCRAAAPEKGVRELEQSVIRVDSLIDWDLNLAHHNLLNRTTRNSAMIHHSTSLFPEFFSIQSGSQNQKRIQPLPK